MKIANYKDIEMKEVKDEGAKDVAIRWVISKDDGAKNFYMRVFDVRPGGNTPYHKHSWEHEVFILDGKLDVVSEKGTRSTSSGDVVFIASEEYHQFRNGTRELARFICLIPKTD
ncbi:MAG: cupin domain-containing protein [Candidatus Lindowbacteria bacterium]|nr:cupin domain-containing protein [Candidatus Lindowbacteria bacterium]